MHRTQRNVDPTIVVTELSVKGTLNGLSRYCEITKPYEKSRVAFSITSASQSQVYDALDGSLTQVPWSHW